MRFGAMCTIGVKSDVGPEYNFLRGFIAVCMGAIGFGVLSSNAGGLFGAIAAADLKAAFDGLAVVVGILSVLVFLWMGALVMHVKISHLVSAWAVFMKWLRFVGAAFRLTKPIVEDGSTPDVDDAGQDGDKKEQEKKQKVKRSLLGRKTDNKKEEKKKAVVAAAPAPKVVQAVSVYELPDTKLLERSNFSKYSVTPELKQNARSMEVKFAQYGVRGKVVGIKPGPIVTLYEFMPDDGTRMADVNKTVTDMTRAMATESIRIAHIPRTQLIGVEMVNLTRQTVRYRGLLENPLFVESKYKIPLALGVDIGGNPMYFDLAKMPHMLVAGRTGSGKSVFVQSIITSIVYHFTPDKCKLIIIDPKGVDFGFWDDIPHLITPIVKLEPEPAVNALKWAVREMEERYKQMQQLNARNIESYNEIAAQKRASGEKLTKQVAVGTDEETGELLFETQEIDLSDLPYMVIIIDEVADLMSLARKEVEACVQRIAQKARAVGIHMIIATQRPSTNVITGLIKANCPARIAFKVTSGVDSKTILDTVGAQQLIGRGDMLLSNGSEMTRVQCAFIDTPEVEAICEHINGQVGYPNAYILPEPIIENDTISGGGSGSNFGDRDEYFDEIARMIVNSNTASTSSLQRRYNIGYNRAGRIMDQLEAAGIVGPSQGGKPRAVLVDAITLETILGDKNS